MTIAIEPRLRERVKPITALAVVFLFLGCTSTERERPTAMQPATRTELAMRSVPQPEWEKFLAEVIVALFPTGVTVLDASGHRAQAGKLSSESSRMVVVLHPSTRQNNRALEEIRREFKARFGGEVLRTDSPAIVAF